MKNFWKAANFKGHLLTAISYMIPIVCGAGFVIAIGMAFGGTSQDSLVMGKFNFLDVLDAQRTLIAARTQYLAATAQATEAWVRIERIYGDLARF